MIKLQPVSSHPASHIIHTCRHAVLQANDNGWIKMVLGVEVGLGSGHNVLDRDPAPLPKKGGRPQSLLNFGPFYCGQTAGCIKMPLSMEVGLIPNDFVLDGEPAPSQKGAEPPICGPRVLWPNGCVDQDATWYRGKTRPRRRCFRWTHSSALKGAQPPVFGSCLLWPNGWMDE